MNMYNVCLQYGNTFHWILYLGKMATLLQEILKSRMVNLSIKNISYRARNPLSIKKISYRAWNPLSSQTWENRPTAVKLVEQLLITVFGDITVNSDIQRLLRTVVSLWSTIELVRGQLVKMVNRMRSSDQMLPIQHTRQNWNSSHTLYLITSFMRCNLFLENKQQASEYCRCSWWHNHFKRSFQWGKDIFL